MHEPVDTILEPIRRNDTRRNLVGLSRAELKAELVSQGLEPVRAGRGLSAGSGSRGRARGGGSRWGR